MHRWSSAEQLRMYRALHSDQSSGGKETVSTMPWPVCVIENALHIYADDARGPILAVSRRFRNAKRLPANCWGPESRFKGMAGNMHAGRGPRSDSAR
jgi:hypothetical protein